MLISTENISVGEVLALEQKGYRVVLNGDSDYADIIKEDKNESVGTSH